MNAPGPLATSLVAAAQRWADRPALTDGTRTLSYRELLSEAEVIARGLRATGCDADEPVHVVVANEAGDVAALLGTWLAGAVAVPVHRDNPQQVNRELLTRTGARLQVDARRADPVTVVAEETPPTRPLLGGAAFIVFTSGSTGVPKGVVISHAAFDGKLDAIDSLMRYGAGETSLLVLNLTFSFGMWVTLLTLRTGGRLVLHPRFEPASFVAAVAEHAVTRVGMVPTMMRMLYADPELLGALQGGGAAASLRQIMIGGEPLGASLRQAIGAAFPTTTLIDIYGLTETATCDFFGFPDDAAAHPGAIGRPSPGVAFRIGAPDAEGVGELQLRSRFLMTGYLDDEATTAAAYDDGWFRTGDLAQQVGPQVVALMGRTKELISRGGVKVAPIEIEHALATHPDVVAALVTGVPDEVLGQRIHAMLIPRTGAAVDLADVAAHAETHLGRGRRPDFYSIADQLPLGRTGKADRGALAAAVRDGQVHSHPRPSTRRAPQ